MLKARLSGFAAKEGKYHGHLKTRTATMRAARLIGVLGVPWAHIDARPSFPGFDSVP